MLKEAREQFHCMFDIFASAGLAARVHAQLRIAQIHRPKMIKTRVNLKYLNPSFAESIGPIVLPQEESLRTTNRCNSTPLARRATSSNRTIPGEFVA
jgi:hypothetical protein